MQQRIASSDAACPTEHFRTTDAYLDAAHPAGLTAVRGRSTNERSIVRGSGPLGNRRWRDVCVERIREGSKSIAVCGGRHAAGVVAQSIKLGFAGRNWPARPNRDEVAGCKAHRSVADLPGVPDAAWVGVNRYLTSR